MSVDHTVQEILNAVPLPIAVASPVYSEKHELTDLTLVWVNHELSKIMGDWLYEGRTLSQTFPDLLSAGWLRDIEKLRSDGGADRQYRVSSKTSPRPEEVYQLDSRWWGDFLVLGITSLVTPDPQQQDVVRAAVTISSLMPLLPVSYGVNVGSQWLRFATESFLKNMALSKKEFAELDLLSYVHDKDHERMEHWLKLPLSKRPMPLVFRSQFVTEGERWLEIWMAQVGQEAKDTDVSDFFILRDVDTQIKLQAQNQDMMNSLDSRLEILKGALNASRDGYAIWHAIYADDGDISSFRLEFINEASAATVGMGPQQIQGNLIEDVLGVGHYEGLFELLTRALTKHAAQAEVIEVNSPQGWVGTYENKVIPFTKHQVLSIFRDVSEDRREQDRLVWLAENDHLTGVPNRRNLEKHLDEMLQEAKAHHQFAGFVFIDIDDFKTVNDELGHDVGDKLLINFVKRVRSAVDGKALVARIAGDEFALLLDRLNSEQELRDLLEAVFQSMRLPFNHEMSPVTITCSAGGVLASGDQPLSEVLHLADKAMYQAKHDGKNRFTIVVA